MFDATLLQMDVKIRTFDSRTMVIPRSEVWCLNHEATQSYMNCLQTSKAKIKLPFAMCCNLYCEILQSLQNRLKLQSKQLHAVQERSVRACAEGTRDKIL